MTAELQRGIADRLRQALAVSRFENAAEWAAAAGLSRTYVTSLLERIRKGKAGDVGVLTLYALAKVANVSPAWLAYGTGAPTDEGPNLPVLPDNLDALLKSLPPNTYPEALVRQAALVLDVIGEKDLPEELWRNCLDGQRQEARRIGFELTAYRLAERGIRRS